MRLTRSALKNTEGRKAGAVIPLVLSGVDQFSYSEGSLCFWQDKNESKISDADIHLILSTLKTVFFLALFQIKEFVVDVCQKSS